MQKNFQVHGKTQVMENELPEISITQSEQHDTLVKIIRDKNLLGAEDASGGKSVKVSDKSYFSIPEEIV